ncbi:hypothetical protein ACES2I_08870 [Bdellovibrio bacteriovorus]|uniref:hypothetical protein n=1 Tax=Bdellovibrio bacteriovorus TaxID=959 RepID=UPI0035A70D61
MNSFDPMNQVVLEASLGLFSKVSLMVTALVGLVFTMRLTFMVLRVASSYEYGALFGDTVKYLGLSQLFPYLVKLILSVASGLAAKVSFVAPSDVQMKIESFVREVFGEFVLFNVLGKIGDIAITLLCQSFYSVLLALLLAIAPIMLFLSTMLGITQGIGAYFISFISLSMWPLLWNLLGVLGRELWPHISSSPIAAVSFWIVIQILQVLSPVFCIVLFVSLAPSQSLSKAVTVVGG